MSVILGAYVHEYILKFVSNKSRILVIIKPKIIIDNKSLCIQIILLYVFFLSHIGPLRKCTCNLYLFDIRTHDIILFCELARVTRNMNKKPIITCSSEIRFESYFMDYNTAIDLRERRGHDFVFAFEDVLYENHLKECTSARRKFKKYRVHGFGLFSLRHFSFLIERSKI